MKAENREREVSATTSPKVRARQSRFYKDRETSAVLRIDDSAVLCPNIGAEYQHPSAFFFCDLIMRSLPPFSAVATNASLCWRSLPEADRQRKTPSAELRACLFFTDGGERTSTAFAPKRRQAPIKSPCKVT